jgi:hypothetical protein
MLFQQQLNLMLNRRRTNLFAPFKYGLQDEIFASILMNEFVVFRAKSTKSVKLIVSFLEFYHNQIHYRISILTILVFWFVSWIRANDLTNTALLQGFPCSMLPRILRRSCDLLRQLKLHPPLCARAAAGTASYTPVN